MSRTVQHCQALHAYEGFMPKTILFLCQTRWSVTDDSPVSSDVRRDCAVLRLIHLRIFSVPHSPSEGLSPVPVSNSSTSLLLSANEEKRLGVTMKYTQLHRILDTILASYVHYQKGQSLQGITLRFRTSRSFAFS